MTYYCKKCGYRGPSQVSHQRPNGTGECGYIAQLVAAGPSENAAMAQTTAQRQRAYKESMKEAGYVRLEGYVTREQREKYRQLGGDEWLRKAIDRAKVKEGDRG